MVLATDGSKTFAAFLYEDIQWGSSSASIGFNAGDQVRAFGLAPEEVLNLETSSNVDIPGVYTFRVDQDAIVLPSVGSKLC